MKDLNQMTKPNEFTPADKTRAAFWAYWSKQSLSQADIHTALGVEHVNEFKGSKADAIAKINAWVAAKAA